MKKLTALFLVLLYLGTATGVTLHLHYCMGEMVDLKLAESDSDHCENCGMDKSQSTKSGCCKDEFKKIKTDDSRKGADDAFKSLSNYVAILSTKQAYQFSEPSYPSICEQHPRSNSPPRSKSVAVYILNCTYLI
ncbi:HYC_CC_PP family protein [Dyadobacter jiangsuensis]